MTTDKSLLFDGDLELYDGEAEDGAYWFEVLAEGASWGDPQPVDAAVASLLRDGALTETERSENRTVSLRVTVKSTDPVGLGLGIAALHRATGKRTTLRWQDGDYPATVFDVETSRLTEPGGFDDLAYNRNEATYGLALTCLPFARSESLTSTEATAVPSVGDIVNDADSLTGWSATAPGGVSLDTVTFYEGTGSVAVAPYSSTLVSADADLYLYDVTLTQAIDIDAGGYLSFVVRHDGTATIYGSGGQSVSRVEEVTITSAEAGAETYTWDSFDLAMQSFIIETLTDGWKRWTLRIGSARTISSIRWRGQEVVAKGAASPTTRFDAVAVAESATLGSQVLKTVAVGGSARTPGSIHVAAPTDVVGLGQVVVFSIAADRVREGFRPDLRQWWDGTGSDVADTDATNGSYLEGLTSGPGFPATPKFIAPAAMFNSSAHTMVARVKNASTGGDFAVQAQLVVDGTPVGEPLSVYREYDGATADEYLMLPVGTLYLPPMPIAAAATDAVVEFTFYGGVYLDELYAFPVDGDLSIIDCGTGTAGPDVSSHLWIDSPSATQPQGGYWRGATGDRVNAVSAWSAANVPGTHVFEPGDVLLFAASTGTLGPTADVSFYKSWLFNAPQ